MPTGPRIVAIDVGTTSVKVGVFVGGRLAAVRAQPIETRHLAHGTAEQDPRSWLAAIAGLIPLVCLDAGVQNVDAVGLTAESDTLVLVDDSGGPVRPAMLWMDHRGTDEAAELEAVLGRPAIHARTGLRSAFNFTVPKIAWVRRHDPSAFARARWAWQPKDLIFHWLTGESRTDPSSASRTLGYDLRARAWWSDALAVMDVPASLLPPITGRSVDAAPISRVRAAELGLPAAIPVSVGAADRAAEALGLAASPERAMVSTGTATGVAVTAALTPALTDVRLISPHHALHDQLLVLASVPTSGTVLDWLAGLDQGASPQATARLLAAAAGAEPGSGGVLAMLSFSGARSVHWRPDASGAFVGLSLATTRADLARAVIEGIALESRTILAAMGDRPEAVDVLQLVLTGGLHRSTFVCQTMADVTGLPALQYAERDAALSGAMLLAAVAIGAADEPSLQAMALERLGAATVFTPDPRTRGFYEELAAAHARMTAALLDLPPAPAGPASRP